MPEKEGAIAGALAGVVDEGLMAINLSDKHYISDFAVVFITTATILPKLQAVIAFVPYLNLIAPATELLTGPMAKASIPVLLGAYITYQSYTEEKEEKENSPFQLAKDVHGLFGELIEEKELDSIIEQYMIVLVTTELFFANLIFELDSLFKLIQTEFNTLTGSKTGERFNKLLLGASQPLLLYPIKYLPMKAVKKHYNNYLKYKIYDKIKETFLEGETPLKLSQYKDSETLIKTRDKNLDLVTEAIHHLLTEALENSISSTYNIGFLIKSQSTDMIISLNAYNELVKYVTTWLAKKENNNTKLIDEHNSRISTIENAFINDAKTIIAGDKGVLLRQKLDLLIGKIRILAAEKQQWGNLKVNWSRFTKQATFLLNYALLANKVIAKEIESKQEYNIMSAMRSVSSMITWESNHATEIEKSQIAIVALHELLDKINEEKIDEAHRINYAVESADQIAILFFNFSVGVGDKQLVETDELTLRKDIYAITGESGCGKSSFLSKIKGVQNNGIWGNGTIVYKTIDAAVPTITLATQDDYLAPYSTLLELIISESTHNKSEEEIATLKEEASKLLREIRFHDDENIYSEWLEKEDRWDAILSGGQKKKLTVVATIMKAADITILDEIFNGMDHDSIHISQDMLKKYLPNTLLLIVDHHAKSNNYNDFYSQILHFENQTIHKE